MIARLDHRPMLTAALALSTIVLFVVVVTLSALLITVEPPAATSAGESGGDRGAVAWGTGDFYGEGWNNYGYGMNRPQPAQTGDGAYSVVERHPEVVAAYQDNR